MTPLPKLPDLISGFKMLKEVDLNAVRLKAETPLHVLVIGADVIDTAALIQKLLVGPRANEPPGLLPFTAHQPDPALQIPYDSLVLLLMDASSTDHKQELEIIDRLVIGKVATVVCYNKSDRTGEKIAGTHTSDLLAALPFAGIPGDLPVGELLPAILRVCKGREMQLARHIPSLRDPVVRKLIDDTSFTNATYSLTTGLAEIVPVLDLPLNIGDVLILTKNQALMAYCITLAMGMKAEWRDTMPKMAGIVGSAFLWRQLARYLAGLVPVIGIVPKIVISYSGTYVIGEAVYRWCANDEKLNPEELKALYSEALKKGSEVARALIGKGDAAQVQAADKFREIAHLLLEKSAIAQEEASGRLKPLLSYITIKGNDVGRKINSMAGELFTAPAICLSCARKIPKGARFCAFCGKPLKP
jgi:hypothetical protein